MKVKHLAHSRHRTFWMLLQLSLRLSISFCCLSESSSLPYFAFPTSSNCPLVRNLTRAEASVIPIACVTAGVSENQPSLLKPWRDLQSTA